MDKGREGIDFRSIFAETRRKRQASRMGTNFPEMQSAQFSMGGDKGLEILKKRCVAEFALSHNGEFIFLFQKYSEILAKLKNYF